jgi:acetolactate synthase-1/2/3 large subunit
MAKPVTKWAAQVTSTDQIPHMTAHALRTAMAGRPGPVLLEVPIDVLFRKIDPCPIPELAEIERPSPTPAAVERALKLLTDAERPIIVVGGGALFSGAADALRTFASRTGIPVFSNNKAHGLMPADDPGCGGSLSNLAVLRASGAPAPDVALFLGARFGMFTGGDRLVTEDCRLIQVDIDAREFGRLRTVDVPILADCRETLLAFDATAEQRSWPDWSQWAATVHGISRWHEAAYAELPQNDAGPVHPYAAMREIMACLDADTIICADGGESSQWADLVAKGRHPGQFMGHGYLGCLGIGMPFAMGAQIAHPDRRVVCIVGDGAAGLNVQEFDTMVRHDLPVVTVVLNNKAWGMCVHGQQSMYGGNRLVVTMLAEGRYDQVAEGFGCFGAYVERPGDVAAAMREALASNRPACVNIITDLDAVFGVTPQAEATAKAAKPDKRDEIEMPYYDNLKDE